MSDCISCKEDAGEGYALCLQCRNTKNHVTIGNKHISIYINRIIELGMYHNVIIIKCLSNKLEEFNFIIKTKLFFWGLEEIRRKIIKEKPYEDKDEVEVFYIKMEMIPALRGLKTDAKRKGFMF